MAVRPGIAVPDLVHYLMQHGDLIIVMRVQKGWCDETVIEQRHQDRSVVLEHDEVVDGEIHEAPDRVSAQVVDSREVRFVGSIQKRLHEVHVVRYEERVVPGLKRMVRKLRRELGSTLILTCAAAECRRACCSHNAAEVSQACHAFV